jgi:hypothetical protein
MIKVTIESENLLQMGYMIGVLNQGTKGSVQGYTIVSPTPDKQTAGCVYTVEVMIDDDRVMSSMIGR